MRVAVSNPALSAQSCNSFELRLNPEAIEAAAGPAPGEKIDLAPQIWIDGTFLDEPHCIDLPLLIQSLHQQGWFNIFTCGCGDGGCAGIVEGIQVTHHGGRVHWWLRRPQSAGSLDRELREWKKTAQPVEFTFERAQLLAAIDRFLGEVRTLVGVQPQRVDWPVYGLEVKDVLAIDPNRPFYPIDHQEQPCPSNRC